MPKWLRAKIISAKLQNLINPIALRKAKTLWSFGLSECNRVKVYNMENSKISVDPDEVAHYEPSHLKLHCLQIQLFPFFGHCVKVV